jgi:fatty acid desaturase
MTTLPSVLRETWNLFKAHPLLWAPYSLLYVVTLLLIALSDSNPLIFLGVLLFWTAFAGGFHEQVLQVLRRNEVPKKDSQEKDSSLDTFLVGIGRWFLPLAGLEAIYWSTIFGIILAWSSWALSNTSMQELQQLQALAEDFSQKINQGKLAPEGFAIPKNLEPLINQLNTATWGALGSTFFLNLFLVPWKASLVLEKGKLFKSLQRNFVSFWSRWTCILPLALLNLLAWGLAFVLLALTNILGVVALVFVQSLFSAAYLVALMQKEPLLASHGPDNIPSGDNTY